MLRSGRLAVLALVGAAVCLAHGQVTPQKLSPKEIYTKCKDAVVKIETDKGTGTGFFYMEDDLIATCFHVIGDASKIEVKDTAGHSWKVESVYFDRNLDAALLRVSGPATKHLSSADPAAVSVGDDLTVIGNPLGVLEQTLTTGVLSARRETKEVTLFQTSAAISPGSSGSPLLTSSGTVLGFISFTFTEGQSLNMAVGCSAMVGLLKKDPQPASLFLESASRGTKEEPTLKGEPAEEQPTDLYLSLVNRVLVANQNWRISFLNALTSEHLSKIETNDLKRAAIEFQDSLGGSEMSKFDLCLHERKLWVSPEARDTWLQTFKLLREWSSQLYEAEVDELRAIFDGKDNQARRAGSIVADIQNRQDNSVKSLTRWVRTEGWLESNKFLDSVNYAAVMPIYSFERTYFLADPHFPDRAQLGFVSGNPFQVTDIIQGVHIRGSRGTTSIQKWLEFFNFYGKLPDGKSDLVFLVKRRGKQIELGAILTKR